MNQSVMEDAIGLLKIQETRQGLLPARMVGFLILDSANSSMEAGEGSRSTFGYDNRGER